MVKRVYMLLVVAVLILMTGCGIANEQTQDGHYSPEQQLKCCRPRNVEQP